MPGREPRRRKPALPLPVVTEPAHAVPGDLQQERTMALEEQGAGQPELASERESCTNAAPSDEPEATGAPAPSSDEVITRIEQEAQALTPEEQQHLHSHLVSNAVFKLNEETYHSTQLFKELLITFRNLRANSKSFLNIRHDQRAIWGEGDASHRLVGLCVSTSMDPVIYVRSFLVNAREMYVETYRDCNDIEVRLYVRTEQSYVKGRVDLPPGASVTLQSRNDRSTIIGLSSFSIDLA